MSGSAGLTTPASDLRVFGVCSQGLRFLLGCGHGCNGPGGPLSSKFALTSSFNPYKGLLRLELPVWHPVLPLTRVRVQFCSQMRRQLETVNV